MNQRQLTLSFISEIVASVRDRHQAFVEILRARGFLLDKTPEGIVLSDNAAKGDDWLLEEILTASGVGTLEGMRVRFDGNASPAALTAAFMEFCWCEALVACYWPKWGNFRNRKHGPKVLVSYLDPFVARLVKAVNAAGLGTYSACDGHGENRLDLNFTGVYYSAWFGVVLQKYIRRTSCLNWIRQNDRWRASHPQGDVLALYLEAQRIAVLLYDNRISLRRRKQLAAVALDSRGMNNLDYKEVHRAMSEECHKLEGRRREMESLNLFELIS